MDYPWFELQENSKDITDEYSKGRSDYILNRKNKNRPTEQSGGLF